MTLLVFYTVDNGLNWGRHDFDNLGDRDAFEKIWRNRRALDARIFDMESHYGNDVYGFRQEFCHGGDFEDDYNDELFDGGWWTKVVHLTPEDVRSIIHMPDEIRLAEESEETAEILISDERFGDKAEHPITLTFRDGKAEGRGIIMEYPKLEDLTNAQIMDIDDYVGGRIVDSGVITPYDVALAHGKIVSWGIMNENNGHNPDLVRKINMLWAQRGDAFELILKALYKRDLNEIFHSDAFVNDNWRVPAEALVALETAWEEHAGNYLMHIADDGDLEAIIAFVR